jgi:DNA (cytosine-5)-methyltransferase 1
MIRYGSVCSGIEAASVAWHPLGWEPAFFSEIEAFPRAVLAHHYPAVPLHGDFTTIGADDYGAIDLLVGGTPCQSFSVAGLRGGMADGRGNLSLEYIRLARRKRARWVAWENVPGVFSSNEGDDFRCFLSGLAGWHVTIPAGGWQNSGIIAPGPGNGAYGLAWRVLDAQHFGVPQRRRRVFVVGHIGSWQRAAAVLFERHSLQGHPAPRREKGQVSPTIPSRSLGGGGLGTDFDCDGGLICADVAPTLNAHFGDKQGLENQHINGGGACLSQPLAPETAMCLNAGAMGRQDAESETLIPVNRCGFDVTHALRGEGFDASEDGTGRGTPLVPVAYAIQERAESLNPDAGPQGAGFRDDDTAYTLEARNKVQAVAFAQNSRDEVRMFGGDGQTVGALGAEPGMKQQCYVATPAVGFSFKDSGNDAADDLSPTLRSLGAYDANGGSQMAAAAARRREGGAQFEGPSDTANIRAASGGSSRSYVATWAVRRLTPRECERLQGFPDDFTLVPHRGKPAADGPRYKALGNSMAVPVMRWIGDRIAAVEAIPLETEGAE